MKNNILPDNIQLVNAVGGGSLGVELDLISLVQCIPYDVNYEPEQHSGLYFKIPDTGTTVMLFRTGEYHLTGGESIESLRETKEVLIKTMENLSVDINKNNMTFEVRNLVYTADIEKEIDLSTLSVEIGLDKVEYNPETSSALFYSPPNSQGTFFLFRTGKLILAGCNSEKNCKESFYNLINTLEPLIDYPPTN